LYLIKFSIKSDLFIKIFLKKHISWPLRSLDLDLEELFLGYYVH